MSAGHAPKRALSQRKTFAGGNSCSNGCGTVFWGENRTIRKLLAPRHVIFDVRKPSHCHTQKLVASNYRCPKTTTLLSLNAVFLYPGRGNRRNPSLEFITRTRSARNVLSAGQGTSGLRGARLPLTTKLSAKMGKKETSGDWPPSAM